MSSRLLAFAGHKQAGKTTSSNFLHGYQLRANGVINGFDITTDGKLVIKTNIINDDGQEEETQGFLDTGRDDPEFAEWASYNMWPYIKRYSFAAPLKQIAVRLFNLDPSCVYGDNIKKNLPTPLRWEDMPGVITDKTTANKKGVKELIKNGTLQYHDPGRMSYREFLQFFGTDVCRRIYEDIWFSKLLNDVSVEMPLIAVVDDCRFINEVEAIKNAGGKVVYLKRKPYEDTHASECELASYDGFDLVIDNTEFSIHETNVRIIEALDGWGWLGKNIKPEVTTAQDDKHIVGGIHKIKG